MNRWVSNLKVQINTTLDYDKAKKLICFLATLVVRNECANAIIIPQHLILSLKPTIENPTVHLNNKLTCKDFSRYIHSLPRNTGQTRSGIQAVSIPYPLSFRLVRNVAFDRQNREDSSHHFPAHPRHFHANILYTGQTRLYLGRYHPLGLVFQIYNVHVIVATDGPRTAQ